MKNRKVALLTVLSVVIVAAGILVLSKLFENGWQNENTVDNSLDAEIVDSSESVFNYPYINTQMLENDKNSFWNNIIGITSDIVSVPENAISI